MGPFEALLPSVGEVSRLRAQRGQGPLAGQQPFMLLGAH